MTVRISDVIVPEIFGPYMVKMTEQKSNLIRSGAIVVDPALSAALAGEGLTFNKRYFKDLDNEDENISNDDPANKSTPSGISSFSEQQVRLSRNKSWSTMDLVSSLIAPDPQEVIASLVSDYWVRRTQAAFVATVKGVFADNAAAPTGSEHVMGDLTHDISGTAYSAGVTDFSAEAFIDSVGLLGDSMGDLSMIMVHSVVYARMQKNNLIDFIPDAVGQINIPTFLGRRVIVDDGVPYQDGVFQSWLFGSGAFIMGSGSPKVPVEVFRDPSAGNGSGQETLYSRVEWALHPVGHAFSAASIANGGPSNAATTGNLAHADSWKRVFPERKQIKIARLLTREF